MSYRGAKIINVRFPASQLERLLWLCKTWVMSPSTLLRTLVDKAYSAAHSGGSGERVEGPRTEQRPAVGRADSVTPPHATTLPPPAGDDVDVLLKELDLD